MKSIMILIVLLLPIAFCDKTQAADVPTIQPTENVQATQTTLDICEMPDGISKRV